MKKINWKIITILSLLVVLINVGFRIIDHPYNFTPLAATFLFFGACFNRRYLVLPFLALILSDLYIGFYDWKLMLAVYGSFAIIGLFGLWLKNNKNIYSYVGLPVLSGVIFYLVTNGAVWCFSSWYAHSWPGLVYCYYMALPFFKNTILGNLFFSAIFFASYEILILWNKNLNNLKEFFKQLKQYI